MAQDSAPKRIPTAEKPGAILAAALGLFAEHGFHATSVPLIAERAGVAIGTLYHYFPSKEAMANELYRRLRREMDRALHRDLPAGVPPPERFRLLWHAAVAYARARPEAFAFLVAHHHGAYLDAASRALDDEVRGRTHDTLEWWRRAGVLKPVPDEVLSAFVDGALQQLIRSAQQGRIDLTPESVDQAAACCWQAIQEGWPKMDDVTFGAATGRLSLSIEPAAAAGGAERRGTVAVASWNFQALGKVWFALADLVAFQTELQTCHQRLDGTAAFRTTDGNLEFEVVFAPRGQVRLQGTFREAHRDGNELRFTIPTDQTYIGQAIEQLQAVVSA